MTIPNLQEALPSKPISFQPLGRRDVVASFDGGAITSDGGALLLREVEHRTGIVRQFAQCFVDHRDPERIEHSVEQLIAQRVFGLALGYEDLNDHDTLRRDPMFAMAVGKQDLLGESRTLPRDAGKPLAGKSTLNRLELTPADANSDSRYKKISWNPQAIEDSFVKNFIQAHPQPPQRIVLDVDATDDPLYGQQEGRFFHGYYGHYCYLPLYIFSGGDLLCAELRSSSVDPAHGVVDKLTRIIALIRQAWPGVRIVVRGDSGFAREEIMAWCEGNGVNYILGLAKNARLVRAIGAELQQVKLLHAQTGQPARQFKELTYRTRNTWSRPRRVVAKAEHLDKGTNPRFVVTSLSPEEVDAQTLYEKEYCARGDMENRIKEQQLALFADRTSTATMRANQLRLWLSSVAYTLVQALRRCGLQGTDLARAQCQTIRLKLLRIGAQVRVTVRKVWVSLASGYPYQELFAQVLENLRRMPACQGAGAEITM